MRLRPWRDGHRGRCPQVRRSISFATGRVRPNGRRVACEFVCSRHGCLYKRSEDNAFRLDAYVRTREWLREFPLKCFQKV